MQWESFGLLVAMLPALYAKTLGRGVGDDDLIWDFEDYSPPGFRPSSGTVQWYADRRHLARLVAAPLVGIPGVVSLLGSVAVSGDAPPAAVVFLTALLVFYLVWAVRSWRLRRELLAADPFVTVDRFGISYRSTDERFGIFYRSTGGYLPAPRQNKT